MTACGRKRLSAPLTLGLSTERKPISLIDGSFRKKFVVVAIGQIGRPGDFHLHLGIERLVERDARSEKHLQFERGRARQRAIKRHIILDRMRDDDRDAARPAQAPAPMHVFQHFRAALDGAAFAEPPARNIGRAAPIFSLPIGAAMRRRRRWRRPNGQFRRAQGHIPPSLRQGYARASDR